MTTSEILESRMERALPAETLGDPKAPPAQMSTPLGLLPVNAEGMRRLSDALAQAKTSLEEISKGLSEAQEMLDVLRLML